MVARFVLWSLADSPTSVAELRTEQLPSTPGATYEAWFSDEATERFGAFAIFPNAEAAAAPVTERVRELVARDPDVVELFDLESHE